MDRYLLAAALMVPFAASSVLNRAGVGTGLIGPLDFAAIRTGSGALLLLALLALQQRRPVFNLRKHGIGATMLLTYMVFFSLAYLHLDAGLGALMLFGGVQVTMFAGAIILKEPIPPRRWIGGALAFLGLAYLLWPQGDVDAALWAAASMILAAIGWGIYSLAGRGMRDPLGDTALNFTLASPAAILIAFLFPSGTTAQGGGILLALAAGAGVSAWAYVLWYRILPQISRTVAAVLQLTVPVIALIGAMIFLGEALTLRFVIASALVAAGVLTALSAPQRTISSKGS